MKKNKFMTIYLREDEWKIIKYAMELYEETSWNILRSFPAKEYRNIYNIVYHFNHVAVDNIEELARKEERRRKRDKSKQKKD